MPWSATTPRSGVGGWPLHGADGAERLRPRPPPCSARSAHSERNAVLGRAADEVKALAVVAGVDELVAGAGLRREWSPRILGKHSELGAHFENGSPDIRGSIPGSRNGTRERLSRHQHKRS